MRRVAANGPGHQMFTGCWNAGHRLSALWFPFTVFVHSEPVPNDLIADSLDGPLSLLVMSLLVVGDAFFVVVPGEVAVTALGALSVSNGSPALWAVIVCAAIAATLGDACCYLIGRFVGTERWRWMRTPRVQQALGWARRRLDGGMATVLFTARFVPFARLAINLVAGASRLHPPRYLALAALAATAWAVYQAAVGAAVAAVVPGGPLIAVPVSIGVAVGVGVLIDLATRRRRT